MVFFICFDEYIKLKDFKVMLIEEEMIYQTIKKKIVKIV